MVLGFCGRLRSGKSELARVCQMHGYEKLSFATPLKELCATILSTTVDDLNSLKNSGTKIDIILDSEICGTISKETGIPIDIVEEKSLGKLIGDVRELLQFVGTDIIREYNTDWHVEKLRKMILPDHDYVFDDVRFKNEKAMIEECGGDCWFVTRPILDPVSNHESETSILWHDCFNKVIINNKSLDYLKFKWENFLDDYEGSVTARDIEFNRILNNCKCNPIENLSALDMLFISEDFFTYVPMDVEKERLSGMKMTAGNGLQLTYADGSMELVYNSLVIEDLKLLV